uniref:peptidylprolyl isomerase n=1 Tax=Habenaria pantlingiana TaxID=1498489 RepID=A0A0F7CZ29_9ASPA
MASSSLSAPLLPNGLNFTKKSTSIYHKLITEKAPNAKLRPLYSGTGMVSSGMEKLTAESTLASRRVLLGLISAASALKLAAVEAIAAGLPEEQKPRLCDEACEKELENISVITTESGLQYKDIQVGTGPSPPIGFQVAANYIAMVPNGQIFDSSLEKGQPYIFRVGSGQVIKGLDEGILSMKVGGKRRLFIPGRLAFPKGLSSAPGRPRVAPNSPVVFDVSLEFIPGLEVDE